MLALVLSLLSIPLVAAGPLQNIGNTIIGIGGLSFLNSSGAVIAFTRILIGTLVFTIFFASLTVVLTEQRGFTRNQNMVIALVLAIISAIFLPAQVILGIGAGFGTLVGVALIALPVIAILSVFLMTPSDTRAELFIKFVVSLILLWVLAAMSYHVKTVLGGL